MKITIAHLVEEIQQAESVEAFIKKEHPTATVKRSQKHPPYRHIYIATGGPVKRREKNPK